VLLRPGALFVVGDPKQSIYRFRRADIDIYQRVRACILASGGQVATLTACFRSVPALCEWANLAFGALFPAEPTAQQPAFAALQAGREDKGSALGVRRLEIPETVTGADAMVEFEADAIARYIRAQVDARRRAPGDFLLLTRARRALPTYTKAMEAMHLPVEVSGGAAFARSPAVTGLADLLAALIDPDDGPAVVGVLRGPLFGLSDAELFRQRKREPEVVRAAATAVGVEIAKFDCRTRARLTAAWATVARTLPTTRCRSISRPWPCESYSILLMRSRLFSVSTTVLVSGSVSSALAPE
jgi:ATP-dependent helicase/nuclease subunit A